MKENNRNGLILGDFGTFELFDFKSDLIDNRKLEMTPGRLLEVLVASWDVFFDGMEGLEED